MKRYFTTFVILLAIAACNNTPQTGQTTENAASVVESGILSHPDYEPGLNLVIENDCYNCHKVEEKLVGPAYKDVAAKYASQPDAVDRLADKIMTGGKGVWGDTAMTPHPTVTKEDAVKIVKYIMLLKQ